MDIISIRVQYQLLAQNKAFAVAWKMGLMNLVLIQVLHFQ